MSRRISSSNESEPLEIDSSVAHVARMYDYLLGGSTNFAVDREAVEQTSVAVGGIENACASARANRAFLRRAVRYLADEGGVRQFLDLGCGIPNGDNVHELAQRAVPECRVVYVDNDPIVLAHAHDLLKSTPEGTSAYIHADLREPQGILKQAEATLDFREPVALLLVAVLHLVPDEDEPYGIVSRLIDTLPSGSYLVVSHLASDIRADEMAELVERLDKEARETFVLRDRAAFSRFFDGLEVVEPGVVRVEQWRADKRRDPAGGWTLSLYGAVGRKP